MIRTSSWVASIGGCSALSFFMLEWSTCYSIYCSKLVIECSDLWGGSWQDSRKQLWCRPNVSDLCGVSILREHSECHFLTAYCKLGWELGNSVLTRRFHCDEQPLNDFSCRWERRRVCLGFLAFWSLIWCKIGLWLKSQVCIGWRYNYFHGQNSLTIPFNGIKIF